MTIEEMYAKLFNAGFVVEIVEDSFIVSLTNRSVNTDEVKFVADYDENFTYTRAGNKVIVR